MNSLRLQRAWLLPAPPLCRVLRYTVLFIRSTEPNVLLAGALLSISIHKVFLRISRLFAIFSCRAVVYSRGLICAPDEPDTKSPFVLG